MRLEFGADHPGLLPVACQTPVEMYNFIKTSYGRLDALIHNDAYPAEKASIEEVTPVLLTETMTHLVHNAALRTGALAPLMKAQQSGKIVFVTSAAPLRGLPNYSVYVAARGAANALMLSLAQELARWNIQVNALAPNFIESPTYFPAELMENEVEDLSDDCLPNSSGSERRLIIIYVGLALLILTSLLMLVLSG